MRGGRRCRRGSVRQLVRIALALAVTAVLSEAVTRIYFANQIGERLYYYGTPWHRNQQTPSSWTTE